MRLSFWLPSPLGEGLGVGLRGPNSARQAHPQPLPLAWEGRLNRYSATPLQSR